MCSHSICGQMHFSTHLSRLLTQVGIYQNHELRSKPCTYVIILQCSTFTVWYTVFVMGAVIPNHARLFSDLLEVTMFFVFFKLPLLLLLLLF